jgi:hypothetical protein
VQEATVRRPYFQPSPQLVAMVLARELLVHLTPIFLVALMLVHRSFTVAVVLARGHLQLTRTEVLEFLRQLLVHR